MGRNRVHVCRFRRSVLAAALAALLATSSHVFSEPPPQVARGLDALAKGDYQTADDDFRDAVQSSGPEAYHAIGTAEAAIPGRELHAMCWLAAYLAAEPHAANAAEVRAAIAALEAKRREKTFLLLQCLANAPVTSANPAENRPQWDNGPTRAEDARDETMRNLASSWDATGDFDTGRRIVGIIHWEGAKSDALTALVRAECDEASRRFEAGDSEASARLLAAAEKDNGTVFVTLAPDPKSERTYAINMARLEMARDLIAAGKLDQARHFVAIVANGMENDNNADTVASIATAEIVLARAEIKAGDKSGARATLVDAARFTQAIKQNGSPLQLQTLLDLADAQTEASDLAGARASLTTALPLVVIYNDPDHSRLDVVKAQLKAGDKDGAQKTVALMTDPALKARALQAIAAPPSPSPNPGDQPDLTPPLPSQYLALPRGEPPHPAVTAAQWLSLIELNLDAPCFTAFRDESDPAAVANAIEQEPVRLAHHAGALNSVESLELVSRRMVEAQVTVDRLLELQFHP
jgi:hypothetical protein